MVADGAAVALTGVALAARPQLGLLPATANWFCGRGTQSWDAERRMLVEPHPPHAPLGIVHLAGQGMKERLWDLPVLQGWRYEVFGKDALELVEGRLGFGVEGGRLKMTRIADPTLEPAEPLAAE